MEIERKYLIKQLPDQLEMYECKVIEQGYLCTDPVVRIRKSNDKYYMTYKSKFGVDESVTDARVNQEVEVPLHEEGYEHLKKKVDGNIVKKKRYIIPIEHGLNIELDVFEDYLQGLILAEVEFPEIDAAERFTPPLWFKKDVSSDDRFTNSYLSQIDSYQSLGLKE